VPYFKIDDGFWAHPKIDAISDAALALWTKAGSWCMRYLTDGLVPADRVRKLGYRQKQVDELLSAGLWQKSGSHFQFHDWFHHQTPKWKVEEERDKDRARKQATRPSKPKANPEISGPESRSDTVPEDMVDSRSDSGTESRRGEERRGSLFSDLSSGSDAGAREDGAESDAWTAGDQRNFFIREFEISQRTTPSMGGKTVGSFHADVLRTARLQRRQPRDLFSETLLAWFAQGLREMDLRAPYACFHAAWGGLTSQGRKAPPPGPQAPQTAFRGRREPARATTGADFEGAEDIKTQLERQGIKYE